MSNTRIYLVAACIGGIAQAPRLIEAGTAAGARNHATRNMLTVKPAGAKDVARLIAAGTTLEIANETPVEQQELPGADDGTTGGAGLGTSPKLPDATLSGGSGVEGGPVGNSISDSGDAHSDAGAEAAVAMAEDTAAGGDSEAAWPHPTTARARRRR